MKQTLAQLKTEAEIAQTLQKALVTLGPEALMRGIIEVARATTILTPAHLHQLGNELSRLADEIERTLRMIDD